MINSCLFLQWDSFKAHFYEAHLQSIQTLLQLSWSRFCKSSFPNFFTIKLNIHSLVLDTSLWRHCYVMNLTFEFKDALTFIYHYLCFVQLVTKNFNKFNKFTNKTIQVLKSDEQSGHISLCLSLTFSKLSNVVSCSRISNSVKVGWFKA